MSVIYMVHPTHGAKVAISESEAISDEMYGWERYDVSTPAAADVDDEDEEVEAVNEMAEPKRRRGRPRAAQEE
jgi:hypothetical protein